MKARELISILQKMNPEAEVIAPSSNFELRGSKVPVPSYAFRESVAVVRRREFTDAFDYETYTTEVWEVVDKEKYPEATPVVIIG